MSDKPKLDVEWNISESSVKITYVVENTTGTLIYLVNVLTVYERNRGRVPRPEEAYVFFHPHGVIEFSKRIPRAPDGRLVHPYTWFVTALSEGRKFAEQLTFALPLRENRPYLSYTGRPVPEPQCAKAKAKFVLGYLVEHPLLKPTKEIENGVPVLRVANPLLMSAPRQGETIPLESTVESEPIQLQIDVIPLPAER